MKFAYIDESGSTDEGDVFVMAGVLIDAYKLRKCTETFDRLITELLSCYPSPPNEIKTKAFINGKNYWAKVDAAKRKEFITKLCDLACENSELYVICLSYEKLGAMEKSGRKAPHYWLAAAMYVTSLIQRHSQKLSKNKGNSVLIFDQNFSGVPKLSNEIYTLNAWYDGLYKQEKTVKGKKKWADLEDKNRFNQIINTAFMIKSEHSSLVQVADAISYIYRRHIELTTTPEAWSGEKLYFKELFDKLERKRKKLGRTPNEDCVDFYKEVTCDRFSL